MSSASREYLRAYARGQSMSQPPRQDDETVEDYAQRIGADPGAPTEPDAPAVSPGEEDTPEEAPAPQGGNRGPSFLDRLSGAVASKPRPPSSLQERIAAIPTPGGAGALLLVLLAMVFFIIPVSAGYTRAQLLWLTFLGKTTLPSTGSPAGATPASSSGSIPVVTGVQQAAGAAAGAAGNGLAQAGLNTIQTGNPFGITLPPLPGSSQPIQLPAIPGF